LRPGLRLAPGAIEDHLPHVYFLGHVVSHFTRIDHDIVRQENEQLHLAMIAPEADDVFCDHLLCGEMRAVKARQIVTPESGRDGDAVDEIIVACRVRSIILGEQGALVRRNRIAGPDSSQKPRRRAERDLPEIRAQGVAEFGSCRPLELSEQRGGGNFLRRPAIEERLLRDGQIAPAERDLLTAALERFHNLPGRSAVHVFR
jgi:hypothetical protein